MIIQAISDTHNRHEDIVLNECDVLVHAGDFTEDGIIREVKDFLKWFALVQGVKHKILIPGNHDVWMKHDDGWCKKFCEANNIHLLINEGVEIDGVKFWGTPLTVYISNDFVWGYNEDKRRELCDMIPDDTDVVISHSPPYKVLDKAYRSDNHYGCDELRKRMAEIKPKAHIFGHVHAGRGKLEKFGTQYINAAQIPEIEDGCEPLMLEVEPKEKKK